MEILNKELSPDEKDDCKILISEYLNNTMKNKKIEAKNANQLFFIIDYLIEFINNKERVYKEKMNYLVQDNKELARLLQENKNKIERLTEDLKDDKHFIKIIENLNLNFDCDSILKKEYSKNKLEDSSKIIETEENKITENVVDENQLTGTNLLENNLVNVNQNIYKKSKLTNKKLFPDNNKFY